VKNKSLTSVNDMLTGETCLGNKQWEKEPVLENWGSYFSNAELEFQFHAHTLVPANCW